MRKITIFKPFAKRALLFAALSLVAWLPVSVFAQTDISTEQGLRNIALNTAGSYRLTADIVLTSGWTPIAGFTGTLNGNGHIIRGLSYNNSATNSVGLFSTTNTGATITKLGIEDANLVGNADVGGIVGLAIGTTITECYVANSYIEGRDHVGSIAGALKTTSKAENCYGTAVVASRQYQVGGLAGIIVDAAINKCYFSGLVYTTSGGSNAGGLVSLVDGGTVNSITNCVAVVPYILGGTVCKILANTGGRACTLTNNYGLDAFQKGTSVSALATIPSTDTNVGTDKIHGAEVTKANAQTTTFYSTTLGWDMTNVWNVLDEGQIYPTLKWQQTPIKPSILNAPIVKRSITVGNSVTVKVYGSLGQVVTLTNPATSYFTSVAVDNGQTYTGTQVGITTVTVGSAVKPYLTTVSSTFNVDVYDPASEIPLSTVTDLVNIRYDLGRKYILMNDIDATSIAAWSPIVGFTGTLNGNGHIIKGLTFNSSSSSIGFFATTTGATITKLGIENARFVGTADVAALVGVANSTTITECYVSNSYLEGSDHVGSFAGNLKSGSVIRNCYSTANVVSRSSQAGGFAGVDNDATIDKCYFSGLVTTSNSNTGGFISLLEGVTNISNSVCLAPYLIGGTVGRLIGYNNGKTPTLTNNYALDELLRGSNLTALNTVPTTDANYGTTFLHGANVTKADAKTASFYSTTLGWDMSSVWTIAEEGQIYPILKWQTTPVTPSILGVTTDKKTISVGNSLTLKAYGSLGQDLSYSIPTNTAFTSTPSGGICTFTGAASGQQNVTINSVAKSFLAGANLTFTMEVFDPNAPIEIRTATDLANIKNNLARNYVLMNNIDLSSIADWTPIGTDATPFTGTFDGAGFTISKLKINQSGTSRVGLFGVTGSPATIKKLALTQVDVIGNADAGGLIGKANGTTVSQVYVTGKIEGNDHVGAIVGGITGGTVTNITNCYANAVVSTRSSQVGGLAGAVSSTTISNCYFAGTVTAPTTGWTNNAGGLISITEDANVSLINSVSAASNVTGGTSHPFVARNAVTITNCSYLTDMVLGGTVANNGGTVLDETKTKLLADLQLQSTYTTSPMNWNFSTIWKITAGSLPTLVGVGADITTSMTKATNSSYNVFVANGYLKIEGAANALVTVYNVSGILVNALNEGVNTVKLPSKGIYLVRIVEKNNPTTIKVVNN
jgi:hypothetical protein